MIYSFDIFETLVSRTTGTPAGIFDLVEKGIQNRGLSLTHNQAQNFRCVRTYCQRAAYLESLDVEINLDDIYRKVGEFLQISASTLEQIKRLEIESEIESAFPILPNLGILFEAIENDHQVVLTADTYLPKHAVVAILNQAAGPLPESLKYYLSSESGKTKRSGDLYRFVLEREKAKPSEIFHLGDDLYGDYLVPKSLGIRAKHVDLAKLQRWEKIGILTQADGIAARGGLRKRNCNLRLPYAHYPEFEPSSLGYWERASGLSKRARLSGHSDKYLLGYSVSAPLLVPFSYWLLQEARRRKLNRLFFVARDGQVFLRIAKQLQMRGIGTDIDLRYIYGSRRAWHLPSFRNFDDRDLFWIFDSRHGLTFSKLATRLGLELDEFYGFLKSSLEDSESLKPPNMVLRKSEIQRLPKFFRNNRQLQNAVSRVASNARVALREYLDQEGWNDQETSHALVDIGWSGRSQDSLYRALNDDCHEVPLAGLYFGLHSHSDMSSAANSKTAFALSPQHFHLSPSGRDFLKMIHVLECFTAADHGGTVAYERKNETIEPQLDDQGSRVLEWGFEEYQQGVMDFVADVANDDLPASSSAVRDRLRDLHNYLFNSYPDDEIARSLGSFPFSPEMDGTGQSEFGPRLTFSGSLRYLTINPRHKSAVSSWIMGSYSRGGLASKFVLSKPSQVIGNLIFHPIHTSASGARFLIRLLPESTRSRIRYLIPRKLQERIEFHLMGKKPRSPIR